MSPLTRLVAQLWNATQRPSAEIEGTPLPLFPCTPAESTLTRSVTCRAIGAASARASRVPAPTEPTNPCRLIVSMAPPARWLTSYNCGVRTRAHDRGRPRLPSTLAKAGTPARTPHPEPRQEPLAVGPSRSGTAADVPAASLLTPIEGEARSWEGCSSESWRIRRRGAPRFRAREIHRVSLGSNAATAVFLGPSRRAPTRAIAPCRLRGDSPRS